MSTDLEQQIESVVLRDIEEKGFIVTDENFSYFINNVIAVADDADIDDILMKHEFLLEMSGISRHQLSNGDILIAISRSSEYYGAHLAYMAIREGIRDIDEIVKLVELMEARAISVNIQLNNLMVLNPTSVTAYKNTGEPTVQAKSPPRMVLSPLSASNSPSSPKISSKVRYTSTEVPGDDVNCPPEQLVDSNDSYASHLSFSGTVTVYTSPEESMRSRPDSPEHQESCDSHKSDCCPPTKLHVGEECTYTSESNPGDSWNSYTYQPPETCQESVR